MEGTKIPYIFFLRGVNVTLQPAFFLKNNPAGPALFRRSGEHQLARLCDVFADERVLVPRCRHHQVAAATDHTCHYNTHGLESACIESRFIFNCLRYRRIVESACHDTSRVRRCHYHYCGRGSLLRHLCPAPTISDTKAFSDKSSNEIGFPLLKSTAHSF